MTTMPNKPPEPAAMGRPFRCRGSRRYSAVASLFKLSSIERHHFPSTTNYEENHRLATGGVLRLLSLLSRSRRRLVLIREHGSQRATVSFRCVSFSLVRHRRCRMEFGNWEAGHDICNKQMK